MGFGSYDESEQENQEIDTDEDETQGVAVHENEHDGSVDFEMDASTDDLLDKLDGMKADPEAE